VIEREIISVFGSVLGHGSRRTAAHGGFLRPLSFGLETGCHLTPAACRGMSDHIERIDR
jgi:hypothetical protein